MHLFSVNDAQCIVQILENPGDVAPIGTNPCAIPIAAEKPRGRYQLLTGRWLVGIWPMSPQKSRSSLGVP